VSYQSKLPSTVKSVFGGRIGEFAYLVEFGDGLSFEMVGDLLELE
jgi:hypothetical protein